MDNKQVRLVKFYRASKRGRLLFSFYEGDETCKRIEKDIIKLGEKFDEEIGLRVSWEDLQSFFELPECIKLHTVFYMRYSLTIGTIHNPTADELLHFYLACDNIRPLSKYTLDKFYVTSNKYYFPEMNDQNLSVSQTSQIQKSIDEPKIKILGTNSIVYQFLKKNQIHISNMFNY